MKIITTANEMLDYSKGVRSLGSSIGFVPTMGALHQGHASLVETAARNCDKVVVSVFVNPTQFNQSSDLEAYPRTFETDKGLLEQLGADVMFYPTVDEIYPDGKSEVSFDLDGLDEFMEGPNRPGHFNGVVQVVTRLFDLVNPSKAFFGEKDFQQLAVITHMIEKLGYDVDVIGCPTVREAGGLAMSSRNMRLSEEAKNTALAISKTLQQTRVNIEDFGVDKAKDLATLELKSVPQFELEYFELVDTKTLKPANDKTSEIQACVALWIEGVRLIDNMKVK